MAFLELRKSSDYGFSKKVWIAELSFATTDALGLKNIYIWYFKKSEIKYTSTYEHSECMIKIPENTKTQISDKSIYTATIC
jgi:hypothetical protein